MSNYEQEECIVEEEAPEIETEETVPEVEAEENAQEQEEECARPEEEAEVETETETEVEVELEAEEGENECIETEGAAEEEEEIVHCLAGYEKQHGECARCLGNRVSREGLLCEECPNQRYANLNKSDCVAQGDCGPRAFIKEDYCQCIDGHVLENGACVAEAQASTTSVALIVALLAVALAAVCGVVVAVVKARARKANSMVQDQSEEI